jgi:hypothetical protein
VYLLFSMPAAAYRELRVSKLPKTVSFTTAPGLELPEESKEASLVEHRAEQNPAR